MARKLEMQPSTKVKRHRKTPSPPPAKVTAPSAPQPEPDALPIAEIINPPTTGDDLDIPAFLRRQKAHRPYLVADVVPELADEKAPSSDHPIEAPDPQGLNYIELYANEGGIRRFLVVSMRGKTAHLLYIPDLTHTTVEVRQLHQDVTTGKAKWFAVPPNLAARLSEKAQKWEGYGFRFSRNLVNEALIGLGAAPLPISEEMATTSTRSANKEKKASVPKGPGVIDALIEILKNGGGTVDEMLKSLMERFPDRGEKMIGTIRTQLNRLPKQGKLEIDKEGNPPRYFAKGSTPKATNSYSAQLKEQVAKEEKAKPKAKKEKAAKKSKGRQLTGEELAKRKAELEPKKDK